MLINTITIICIILVYVSYLGFHDCVINQNYDPLSLYDLLKPDNWVHHIPLISDEGVTVAWKYLIKSENYENKVIDNYDNLEFRILIM